MNQQQEQRPRGRPPIPNKPERRQVHVYVPGELYEEVVAEVASSREQATLAGKDASMNGWIIDAIQDKMKRDKKKRK